MQRPTGESIRAREAATTVTGLSNTFTPPASAMSQSPECSAWQAWWTATNAELHAVSIATAGPSNPSAKATRPEMALSALPVMKWGSILSIDSEDNRCAYSLAATPTKIPVGLPRKAAGAYPALSRPSHTVSSISRCCGSIQTASRGEMPKNSGSNPSISSRKPPNRV